jgi:16S rRNA (guanine(966)-N(2))-methyltransferase RsmD
MRIIAGEARGRKLFAPTDSSVRPLLDRTRESIFSTIEGAYEGKCVLDLFSGVGSFGLEALSRGARRVVFVDRNKDALKLLRKNVESLSFGPRVEILHGDALSIPDLTADGAKEFALVFIDPPFKMFSQVKSTETIFRRVKEILGSRALEAGGTVILRQPAKFRGRRQCEPTRARTYGESVVLYYSGQ